MEWVIVAILVAAGWIVSSQARGRKRVGERNRALETWEHDERENGGSHVLRLHFPSMRLNEEWWVYEYGVTAAPKAEYLVKRTPACVWEIQHTDTSRRAAIAHHADEAKRMRARAMEMDRDDIARHEHALEGPRAGSRWVELSDEYASSVEVAYQRYLKSAG